jgi:ferritin-like metal-binding protein YciE
MMKRATAEELKGAFEDHLRQTELHVERLEHVFEMLELPALGKKCVGMQNLIAEGNDMIKDADRKLTSIAGRFVNEVAAEAGEELEQQSRSAVYGHAAACGRPVAADLSRSARSRCTFAIGAPSFP